MFSTSRRGQATVQTLLLLSAVCFIGLIVFQIMEGRHYGAFPWLP